jgi:LysM repeat protein
VNYQTHTVQPGDTLAGISQHFYGHPHGAERIRRANSGRVTDSSSLRPGTILHIPY